jgi:hypothetical protein
MLLVNQGFGTIPTCLMLLLRGEGTNDANAQSSKSQVVDKQHLACQRGPSFQRRQEALLAMMVAAVVMRVYQSA